MKGNYRENPDFKGYLKTCLLIFFPDSQSQNQAIRDNILSAIR